jgi:hypothetical protein
MALCIAVVRARSCARTTGETATVAAMRSSIGVLFALFAAASCTIAVTPSAHNKADADAQAPVCCRTNPDAGPEGCLCEPAAKNIVMVTGTTCSVSTTLNGQAIAFTGIVVSTCP